MRTTPTKKNTSERVTGPRNGLIPLVAVLVLTALTWGGLWYLHQAHWQDPQNPMGRAEHAGGVGTGQ